MNSDYRETGLLEGYLSIPPIRLILSKTNLLSKLQNDLKNFFVVCNAKSKWENLPVFGLF